MENSGIRNGVYMGVALVILNLVMYFISTNAFISYASLLSYVVHLYFIYKATADERTSLGGYMSFAEGLKVGFLSFVIGTLIGSLFLYVLYNFIDPNLIEETRRITMEAFEKMSSFLSEEMYDEMEEQVKLAADQLNMGISSILLGYLGQLILPGFIFAVIMSLIMKKTNNTDYA